MQAALTNVIPTIERMRILPTGAHGSVSLQLSAGALAVLGEQLARLEVVLVGRESVERQQARAQGRRRLVHVHERQPELHAVSTSNHSTQRTKSSLPSRP